MSKWKITVKQNKQEGQLDRVRDFLEGPQDLEGFEIITPITQDQKIAMAHAPDLASDSPRSLEVTWNRKTAKLAILAVSRKEDVPNFKNALKLCYPNCYFGPVEKIMP